MDDYEFYWSDSKEDTLPFQEAELRQCPRIGEAVWVRLDRDTDYPYKVIGVTHVAGHHDNNGDYIDPSVQITLSRGEEEEEEEEEEGFTVDELMSMVSYERLVEELRHRYGNVYVSIGRDIPKGSSDPGMIL